MAKKFSKKTRSAMAKQFIEAVVFRQYRELVEWSSVTLQSAQIDSGYLGQHIVSIVTGIKGNRNRGKGLDLQDGSEVKTASTIDAVDVPRWNNTLKDAQAVQRYLASPAIYFLLFDTPKRGEKFPLRVRLWKVEPAKDAEFRATVLSWEKAPKKSRNFQLHPPCWKNSNVATNQAGNLSLPLMFHAEQVEIGEIDFMEIKLFNESPGVCSKAP